MSSPRVRNLVVGAVVFGAVVLGIQVLGSGPTTTDSSSTTGTGSVPTTSTTLPDPVASVQCPPGMVAKAVPGPVPTSSFAGYAWVPAINATSGWCLVKV